MVRAGQSARREPKRRGQGKGKGEGRGGEGAGHGEPRQERAEGWGGKVQPRRLGVRCREGQVERAGRGEKGEEN